MAKSNLPTEGLIWRQFCIYRSQSHVTKDSPVSNQSHITKESLRAADYARALLNATTTTRIFDSRALHLTLRCCVLPQSEIKNVSESLIGAICWRLLGWGFAFGGSAEGFVGGFGDVRSDHCGRPGRARTEPFLRPGRPPRLALRIFHALSAPAGRPAALRGTRDGGLRGRDEALPVSVRRRGGHDRASRGRGAHGLHGVHRSLGLPHLVHLSTNGAHGLDLGRVLGVALLRCHVRRRPNRFRGLRVVHMTGGVTALVGATVVGPRTGRFAEDGSVRAMP